MTDSIEQQLLTAEKCSQLWALLMPTLIPPDQAQFLVWAGMYEEPTVVRALSRAAAKVRRTQGTTSPMTDIDAVRYASSVMRHETMGVRQVPARTPIATRAAQLFGAP